MNKQINEIESVLRELGKATSLFDCVCGTFFEDPEPDMWNLLSQYKTYSTSLSAISDIVREQQEVL